MRDIIRDIGWVTLTDIVNDLMSDLISDMARDMKGDLARKRTDRQVTAWM